MLRKLGTDGMGALIGTLIFMSAGVYQAVVGAAYHPTTVDVTRYTVFIFMSVAVITTGYAVYCCYQHTRVWYKR